MCCLSMLYRELCKRKFRNPQRMSPSFALTQEHRNCYIAPGNESANIEMCKAICKSFSSQTKHLDQVFSKSKCVESDSHSISYSEQWSVCCSGISKSPAIQPVWPWLLPCPGPSEARPSPHLIAPHLFPFSLLRFFSLPNGCSGTASKNHLSEQKPYGTKLRRYVERSGGQWTVIGGYPFL